MEYFGAFYNYSQLPSPQMYFSWKYTKLFVPRSVTQALHEKKKKKEVGCTYFTKQPKDQNFALKL